MASTSRMLPPQDKFRSISGSFARRPALNRITSRAAPSAAAGTGELAGTFAMSATADPGVTLLMADQRACWQRGERVPVEIYLHQHPGLAASAERVLDLINHE